MPHTDTSGAETPDPTTTAIAETMDIATAQRVEQEKLTRRAALRKLGFGAGIAAFSLLGVDDFARMVGQRLQRNAHDNKTAMAVAKEFQSAGIALAESPSGPPCDYANYPHNWNCCHALTLGIDAATAWYYRCQQQPGMNAASCNPGFVQRRDDAGNAFLSCYDRSTPCSCTGE